MSGRKWLGAGMKRMVRYFAGLGSTTLVQGGAVGKRQLEEEGEGGTMKWRSVELHSLAARRHASGCGHHYSNGEGSTGVGAGGGRL